MEQKRIVLGSGYAAVGYALTRGDTLIIEEAEQLDVHFCLPLRAYAYPKTEPSSALGKALFEIVSSLGIIKGELINTGALEIALAKLALDGKLTPLLKCRVTELSERGVEVYTNSGFLSFTAETVHDARKYGRTPDHLTVLLEGSGADAEALTSVFSGSSVEPIVSEGRYALHIPVDPSREPNALRAEIARKWEASGILAKILLFAPTLALPLPKETPEEPTLCDLAYASPLEALEAGVRLALSEMEAEEVSK